MFNFPYRLRKQNKFEVPVGPNLADASILEFDLDSTKIHLKVPRGASLNYLPSKTAQSKIDLSQASFDYSITDKAGWNNYSLLFRSWDFCGDWFLGRLGRVAANLVILMPASLNSGASFFHPRVFEASLADYLKYSLGDEVDLDEKTQDWLCPVDWLVIPQMNLSAALFKSMRTLANHSSGLRCYFACPIDDDKMLLMTCRISRSLVYIDSSSSPEENINDWISDVPMRDFADQLLRGIQVELSSEVSLKRQKALEHSPDTGLSSEFLPIKFI